MPKKKIGSCVCEHTEFLKKRSKCELLAHSQSGHDVDCLLAVVCVFVCVFSPVTGGYTIILIKFPFKTQPTQAAGACHRSPDGTLVNGATKRFCH